MHDMMAADSKQLTSSSYDACCRLCLSDNTSALRDVFGGNPNSAGLLRRIAATLGVKIDASDKITTSICSQCLQKVNNWNTFRKVCVANQTKLDNWMAISSTNIHIKEEPMDEQEESDIEIVESSEDSQSQFFSEQRDVSHHQNGIAHQPDDDLPPTLTPNRPNEDISMDNNSIDVTSAPNISENEQLADPLELDSSTCTICYKTFYSTRNKLRHERNVHGVDVDSTNKSHISGNNDELSEETTVIESIDEVTKAPSISESSKIEFAAGLCLQSKSGSPPSKQTSEITLLTAIEESYILKCKVIITIFHHITCHCHNIVYRSVKCIIAHVRASSRWFPPFTCFNCLITFNGRSAKMRHDTICPKLRMENLIRLSELRGRDDNKIRLYHNYKCLQCVRIFAFFEDFCDHVYYDHLVSDAQVQCEVCTNTFDSFELLKEHSFNSCFLAHYCDICIVEFNTKEEFSAHCSEKHDNEIKFDFFETCPDFKVLSNIEIANLLLTARTDANAKQEAIQEEEIHSEPQNDILTLDDSMTHCPTGCISCENSYSSYHNMIRHLKIAHKFTSLMMQNPLVCPDCGETHGNLYLLVKHRRNHPPVNSESPLTCLTCNESFETSPELRNHIITKHAALLNNMAVPEESTIALRKRKRSKSVGCLKCNECGDTFGRAHELESHRNSHLNLKLYRDSKTQSYRSSLLSKDKEFKCNLCTAIFNTKQKLYYHVKLHRTVDMPELNEEVAVPEDVKPLICKFCSAAFMKQRELFEHIDKKHKTNLTNEATTYPRECIYCSKSISKPGAYANHILMHKRLMADVEFVTNTAEDQDVDDKFGSKGDSNDDESDYHTCKRCFKVFTNRYTLKNHMKLHGITLKTPTRTSAKANKSMKIYWCSICHQGCQGEVEFKRHKLEHLAETNDQLLAMPTLMIEENVRNDEKPLVFSCDICTKYFPTKLALRKHKEKHISEQQVFNNTMQHEKTGFYCKYCKIYFSNSLIFTDHMTTIHDAVDPINHKPSRKKLKRNHAQPQLYTCSICKKTFSTVGALQSHQGWHKRTKGGKYSAKYIISAPSQMKPVHDNRFFCKSCQIGFTDDTSLQLHTLEVHRNVNATIIQPTALLACVVCNLQFSSARDLQSHMRSHSVEPEDRKPLPCQYCDKCFSRSDTLAMHEKQYHAEMVRQREFKCHLCDRVFDRNNSLAIHLKMHAKSTKMVKDQSHMKIYSCSICQIGFHMPKDLRNHIITSHPF